MRSPLFSLDFSLTWSELLYLLISSLIPKFTRAIYFFSSISSASSSLSIDIWIAFLFWRGSIIYLAFCSYFEKHYVGFLSSFTLSAYRSVFKVFSEHADEGDTFPIITVLQKPTNESFSTIVSFEPLKGVWPFPWSKALIHSFKESKDLFISAPSILVCFFISVWSAPL